VTWTLSPAVPRDAVALARILGDWLRGTGWIPILHNRGEDLSFLRRMIASHRCWSPATPAAGRLASSP
jgi:hypothetical protein